MLNSLEGKRGEPRLKPPFPAVEGLYRKPTIVNNVETLAYLVPILERGAEWFASVGTERSKGYKIVSVSGHVRNPGNYEIALGNYGARDHRVGGRPAPGTKAHGSAAGRRFVGLHFRRATRLAVRLRKHGEGRFDARLGCIRRLRRYDRFRQCRLQSRAFLRSRVVRSVHAVPRGRQAGWSACSSGSSIVAASPATMRCFSAFPARSRA